MRKLFLFTALLSLPLFGYLFWHASTQPDTLTDLDSFSPILGPKVVENLSSLPTLPIQEDKDHFRIEDATSDGIQIQYANQSETQAPTHKQTVSFPKDPKKPIEVKLDEQRIIPIQDLSSEDYAIDTLTREKKDIPFYRALFKQDSSPREYLRYQGDRKTLLYAYEKDQATGEKKLKHWTLYASGTGLEEEKFHLDNVKVKINESGDAEVFYFGERQIQNEAVKAEVAPSLLERAQKTLEQDLGNDILNNQAPDFIIPRPYYLDQEGTRHDLDWQWDEEKKTLAVSFSPQSYPVALDPTLLFTAPGQSNTGSVINGEATSRFGLKMIAGDFNSDGKTDLLVSAVRYSSYAGRVYLFYSDGTIATNASAADVTIDGPAQSMFGTALVAGDFNTDGRMDFVVGTSNEQTASFDTYVFYNDGSYPSSYTGASVTITGTGSYYGQALGAGDINADGRTDLIVGSMDSSCNSSAYIFYNDGSMPTTAGTADVVITGTGTCAATSFATGDFNSDGKVDLAVGAVGYSTETGRVYVFYADGTSNFGTATCTGTPTTCLSANADVVITGESTLNQLGSSLGAGDLNADGKVDLIVGAKRYNSWQGRLYVFYNGSIITENASGADVTMSGESGDNQFGLSVDFGDFNGDGRTDLATGSYGWSGISGYAYVFYNDGSYPSTAATADVRILGEGLGNYFGVAVAAGDFNIDGRADLAVGSSNYLTDTGRVYIFYSQNGQVNTNFSIAGNATGDQFGLALTTGDVNADGRTDLIVGANAYSTSTGRAYIFYGDGQIPTAAGSADVTITGNATSDEFGKALLTGDFDADGDTDLAVGAPGYSTNTGRVYLFYNDGSIPTTAATADVTITGESTQNYFGYGLTRGDFNADGKSDLAATAYGYNSFTGRAYIFHNDGSIPTTAATADVTITGETISNYFGVALDAGDFNTDGRTDLTVGAEGYSSTTGRAYIFHNDGSIPTTAATADVTITGETTSNNFGTSFAAGDFNTDGRIDLAVGAKGYSSNTGRVYLLYNDGSLPTTAATADVTITGETTNNYFGVSLTAGDFNADGRADVAACAHGYSSNSGRSYIFYNDGSLPTTAATADVTITGETTSNYFGYAIAIGDMNADGRTDLIVGAYGNTSSTGKVYFYETRENFAWEIQQQVGSAPRISSNGTGQELKIVGEATSNNFGTAMTTGDLNADGKTDLIVGATGYSSNKGRVYIFYNRGSLVTAASSADVAITPASASGLFGEALTVGDFNADGRIDLAVGNSSVSSNTGQVYIFYNDGSYPSSPSEADVTITGESSSYFGGRMASGDFNADGKTDLAVGAVGYSTNTGRAYVFYNGSIITENASGADVTVTGETTLNYFGGYSLTTGDFNADSKTDLAVGAMGYSSNTGRVYIFYNGSIITENASGADIIITGGATGDNFGASLTSGDLNADGKTDLVVGAYGYSTNTGRVYAFYNGSIITENASGADVTITDQSTTYQFGYFGSIDTGDFNADGRVDLAAGSYCYSSCTGRAYIFYNDGSYPASTANADVSLTGEASSSYFGIRLTSGDINADGRTDLVVGAYNYSSARGRVYVYTSGNDVVISGPSSSSNFGASLAAGDFNFDGRIDLAVGAYNVSSNAGAAYIFYSDALYPSTASTADVTIGGESGSFFGTKMFAGDFNADGRIDLVVGGPNYSTNTGRAYVFYNDNAYPSNASSADAIITGETTNNYLGTAFTAADFNADGKTDLVVGAYGYSTNTGRAYVFYNGSIITENASGADVTITGETTSNNFGFSLSVGDFSADRLPDLVVGAYGYSSSTGRVYIFYNGSIATEDATGADVTITGAATSNYFGTTLATGDLDADTTTDLVVGASSYSSDTGRVYVLYNDGSLPTAAGSADVTITGESGSNYFGYSLAIADLGYDTRPDLIVGAYNNGAGGAASGRTYIFYSDGTYPTLAASADVLTSGESSACYYGWALATGDFNGDGKIDLAVGSRQYTGGSALGRAYIIISEASGALERPGIFYLKGTGKMKGTGKLK